VTFVVDWVVTSSLATAGGTLVLAVATFASVRSANNAARTAERALLAGLRPLLVPSRLQDPPEKVHFADGKWVVAHGGGGVAEATDEAIYLAMSVRNVGSGIAVLHGWRFYPHRLTGGDPHADLADFRRLTRDIYVPAGDVGFWQGALRDPTAAEFKEARAAIEAREQVTVDVLYGDHEGGQRVITRFSLLPRDDGQYLTAASRHWNADRADPR
jgi:hypothetical protein